MAPPLVTRMMLESWSLSARSCGRAVAAAAAEAAASVVPENLASNLVDLLVPMESFDLASKVVAKR